jgi:hypothetical protein
MVAQRDPLADSGSNGGIDSTSTRRELLTVDRRSTTAARRRMRNESTEDGATGSATGSVAPASYRVLVIGSQGVGKTTLTQQIMTSEYLANKDSFTGKISMRQAEATISFISFVVCFRNGTSKNLVTLASEKDAACNPFDPLSALIQII